MEGRKEGMLENYPSVQKENRLEFPKYERILKYGQYEKRGNTSPFVEDVLSTTRNCLFSSRPNCTMEIPNSDRLQLYSKQLKL
jgi:hypothetical protein